MRTVVCLRIIKPSTLVNGLGILEIPNTVVFKTLYCYEHLCLSGAKPETVAVLCATSPGCDVKGGRVVLVAVLLHGVDRGIVFLHEDGDQGSSTKRRVKL